MHIHNFEYTNIYLHMYRIYSNTYADILITFVFHSLSPLPQCFLEFGLWLILFTILSWIPNLKLERVLPFSFNMG